MQQEEIRQPNADITSSSSDEEEDSSTSSGKTYYNWDEIAKHNTEKDAWVVLEDKVYNVTNWAKRHPGGKDIILAFAGQNGTEPFLALHPDLVKTRKYMSTYYIGELLDEAKVEPKSKPNYNQPLLDDFRKLREKLMQEGLFDSNKWFFFAMLAHIWSVEFIAYYVLASYGTGWIPYLICGLLLGGAQMQAGWLQHDFGHSSVFKNPKWNRWMHYLTLSHMKGASKEWWNWRHFMHHSKPNVIHKDPDIRMVQVFVVGRRLAQIWGKKKLGFMPYSYQHHYWHLIGPPLLIPIYFQYEQTTWAIKTKQWLDLFWVSTFYMKFALLYVPLCGWWGAFWLYMFMRVVESHWFVYVTQMNHLPMHIDFDFKEDWPTIQNLATCNVDGSMFNDWFTGHLNYQVEHHLFPTMPRHNYPKANVYVRELFDKHGLKLQTKTLWTAMSDVVGCLKEYSDIWYKAYYN